MSFCIVGTPVLHDTYFSNGAYAIAAIEIEIARHLCSISIWISLKLAVIGLVKNV